jgi:hypothetical protein
MYQLAVCCASGHVFDVCCSLPVISLLFFKNVTQCGGLHSGFTPTSASEHVIQLAARKGFITSIRTTESAWYLTGVCS